MNQFEMVDLNDLCTKDTPSPLLLRVDGPTMIPEVSDGDWIVISRSLAPQIGNIAVVSVNGLKMITRLTNKDVRGKAGLYLVPKERDSFDLIGVITKIISDPRARC